MTSPDLSALSSSFVEFFGPLIEQKLLDWKKASDGIEIRSNVVAPQALPKLTAEGNPKPYVSDLEFTTGGNPNGIAIVDRVLTAQLTKWDYIFDYKKFYNTYLARYMAQGMTEAQAANAFMVKAYMDQIIRCMGAGVYNSAGTTSLSMFNGFLTLIANEITASNITPVATGVTTTSNAVAAFEALAESCPIEVREMGGIIYCGYGEFDKYKKNYRGSYPLVWGQQDRDKQEFQMDNLSFTIKPRSWMGTSQRLIATVANNLVFGTDQNQIEIAPTLRTNLIETRMIMPAGVQIADLAAIKVGNQA
jgi:hypothetical protein